MTGTHDEFAHRESLCGCSSDHIGQRRVDKEFVPLCDFPRVVSAPMECQWQFLARCSLFHVF